MTEQQVAEMAMRVGLADAFAQYPEIVRAAAARAHAPLSPLDDVRESTTEPAHMFQAIDSNP